VGPPCKETELLAVVAVQPDQERELLSVTVGPPGQERELSPAHVGLYCWLWAYSVETERTVDSRGSP
jgi:hypothetical protein